MGDFCFGQSIRKLSKNKGKVLFYDTYFEESKYQPETTYLIKISDNNEIWTKKWVSLVLDKVYKNCPNYKKKCYFTKPTLKRVISTGNHLFGPLIIS